MTRRFNARLQVRALEDRLTPAISWTGLAGDGLWFTQGNWAGNNVPSTGDDVIINAPFQSIYYSGGGPGSLKSLDLQAGYLHFDAGQVTLTNGLSISPGWFLATHNAGTSLTVNGATTVNGAGVYGNDATTITLNGLTSVTAHSSYNSGLLAHGGSQLNLPSLSSITGTPNDQFIQLRAFSGGTVNAPALTSVTNGYVEIRADDAGSVVNATALATFDIASPIYGNIVAQSGGKLNVAAGLTKIGRSNLYVSGNSFPAGQLTNITDSTVYASGGESKFNAVTILTGSNIYAQSASTVTFAALTSMTGSVNFSTELHASGGSTLSLPALTTVNANTGSFTSVRAFSGSKLDIPLVSKVDTGYFELRAQDAGSVLDASGLSSLTFPVGTYGNLYTFSDGVVQLAPSFSTIDRTNVAITDGASLPVGQFTSITNSTVETDSATIPFSNVTQLIGTTVYARNSSSVTFGGLTALTGSNSGVNLQAESESTLAFPALTTVTANLSSFTSFRAFSGGTVSVPNVTSITTGYVALRGQDADSLTDFPALSTLSFPSGTYGAIECYYEGNVNVGPGYTALNNIDFHLNSTNGFPVGQLVSAKHSNIFIDGGQPVFTNLVTFESTNNFLQTTTAGTVASFPVLTNVQTSNSSWAYLRAFSGSTLSAPALSKVDTGYVELRGQDADSLLNVPALATLSFPNGTYGGIYTYYGGKIQINAGYTALNNVDFRIDGANSFPVGQLTSATHSSIYVEGGAPVFTNLASFTSQNNVIQSNSVATPSFPALTTLNLSTQHWTYLRAYGGSTLSFPNLTKLDTGYVELRSQDADSVLDLPSMATLTFPAGDSYGYVAVYYGAKINISSAYTAMTDIDFHTDTPSGFPLGQLTSLTNSNLYIDAGQAVFTNLASASMHNNIFQTQGAGTKASFPALTTFISQSSATNYLRVYGGSTIAMPAISKLDTGGIELRAQDAGSVLDMPALTTVTPPLPSYGSIFSYYGGKINTAANLHLFNLQVDFDDQALFNFSDLQLDDGTIVYGYGKLPGNVTNAGIIDSRYFTASKLEIAGNYVQTPTGKLNVDLGGLNQGTEYDWLKVGGSVQLDGTLTIHYLGGFSPALGNAFSPVSGASRSGSFSNYNNLLIGGGLELAPSYTATSAVLTSSLSAGPFVTNFTPTGNQFSAVTYVDVTFNEPIDGNSFATSDVTVAGPGGPYTPSSIQDLGSNSFRIHLPSLSSVGTYTVTVGPFITDIAGSNMNQDNDGTFGEVGQDDYSANFTVVTADFVVQSIDSMPTTGKFGETFNVSYTIRNDGTAAASGAWNDYVYLSTDAVFDGGDLYVGFGNGPGLPVNPTAIYNGTATVSLPLTPVRPDGNYYLIVVADGGNQIPEVNEVNNAKPGAAVELKTPPRVTQLDVNGGIPQRSFVTEVMVTFNEVVTLPTNAADAFTLQRITTPGSNGFVGLVASKVDNNGGQTKVTLTFQNGPLYTGNTLIDGRYELKALASLITDSSGLSLDGNANGVVGDDFASTAVHRLFGDVNGDTYTDLFDFLAFRAANGSDSTMMNWNPLFDINGDTFIDNNDLLAFRQRLGTSV